VATLLSAICPGIRLAGAVSGLDQSECRTKAELFRWQKASWKLLRRIN
jgi:hypothetical protein